MVERSEICCYEYIEQIKLIEEFAGKNVYGLDNGRARLHDELCELFGLSKEITKKYTDNLDLENDKVGENLFLDLLKKSRNKRR